jgi:hypothetical protein
MPPSSTPPAAAGKATPFIVWTLQRTGGTNLARRLFEASGLPGTDGRPLETGTFVDGVTDAWKLHEPFNYGSEGRVFGFASEAWIKRSDATALDAVTDAVCARGLPLKHCVEMVPAEVTLSLINASVRHGYRHVFLFRRNPLGRLLSMEFARRSGVWGPNLKGSAAPDTVVFAKPLDIDMLAEHERSSAGKLEHAWRAIEAASGRLLPVAYEDIYQPRSPLQAHERLLHLLHFLGLDKGRERNRAFVSEIIGSGDQGTRDRYGAFAGITELQARLASLKLFDRSDGARSLRTQHASALPAWVAHANIDTLPALCWPDMPFEVGGVVVLDKDSPAGARLRVDGFESADAHWQLPSPRMAARFPAAGNAACARFRFDGLQLGDEGALTFRLEAGGDSVVLFRVHSGKQKA